MYPSLEAFQYSECSSFNSTCTAKLILLQNKTFYALSNIKITYFFLSMIVTESKLKHQTESKSHICVLN